MYDERVSPEKLAKLVHHYREALAPDFGCRSSASPDWGDLSQGERSCQIAAIRLALLDLSSAIFQGSGNCLQAPEFTGGTAGKECGC